MKDIEMYKEFVRYCKMANVDSGEYTNYLIMKCLSEMIKSDGKQAEAKTQVDYFSKKLVAQEQYNQELRDEISERMHKAWKRGYDEAKELYNRD